MILYVNGDSHTAAAEAVNMYKVASDDSKYFYMGEVPHPDNLSVSWGQILSDSLKTTFHCHAQAGCSNDRIMRTTQDFLTKFEHEKTNLLIVIQWSTWERQEWLIDGKYYQVGSPGFDNVPESHQQKYKKFISNINLKALTESAHNKIWALHEQLEQLQIPHIFFNGNNDFSEIGNRKDWGNSYIGPYDKNKTYDAVLKAAGYKTISPESWHFGPDAHRHWAKHMLQCIIANKFIK